MRAIKFRAWHKKDKHYLESVVAIDFEEKKSGKGMPLFGV